MRRLTSDTTQLTEEFGIQTGRWEQYPGLGDVPFGAMWCVIPPGGHSQEDHHPEVELAVVVSGSAAFESPGTTMDAPPGSAMMLDSYERHVVHNRSDSSPLVFLSLYWLPGAGAEAGDA